MICFGDQIKRRLFPFCERKYGKQGGIKPYFLNKYNPHGLQRPRFSKMIKHPECISIWESLQSRKKWGGEKTTVFNRRRLHLKQNTCPPPKHPFGRILYGQKKRKKIFASKNYGVSMRCPYSPPPSLFLYVIVSSFRKFSCRGSVAG